MQTFIILLALVLEAASLFVTAGAFRNQTYRSGDQRLIWISSILLPFLGPVLCKKVLKLKPLFVLQDFSQRNGHQQLAPIHSNLQLFHTTRHAQWNLLRNPDLSEACIKQGLSLRPPWLERFDWVLHYDLDWVLKFGGNFVKNRNKKKQPLKLTKFRNPPGTIFVEETVGLTSFVEKLLPEISGKILLYVGGGTDKPITATNSRTCIDSLLDSPQISKIFTENKNIAHHKVVAAPIGLSPPEVVRCGSKLLQIQNSVKIDEKAPKVLAGFWQPLPQRERATEFALGNPDLCKYSAEKTAPEDYWKLASQHQFVLSPPGRGMDCFRTYEILAVKSIPIVERSNGIYAEVFEGLPVVVIDDYAEITRENLNRWWQELAPLLPHADRFVQDDYWWNKIAEALQDG